MVARGSSREPILVDGLYRYVAGDALRTVGSLGALWDHHTHGGGIDDELMHAVTSDLRNDIARHTGYSHSASDPHECFHSLAHDLTTNFDSMSSDALAAVISATWKHLARLRSHDRAVTGSVASLHVSRGGVPKKNVESVDISVSGVAGDKQANRTHHGRPWQAVCIWSRDVVDSFAAAGHPIDAGFAGENVSVRGIDWSQVRPGTIVEIGDVSIRITAYSIPCKKNAEWFADRDFMSMSHERGWVSRVYGLVARPGHVTVGDRVTLRY